jgi:hypothetical protein
VTVILNEAAIVALFESVPVVQFVERTAERVVIEAQRNVRAYFATAPSLDVDQDVGLQMDGSTATIGIKDAGNKSRRLARYQAEGSVNWLRSALDAAR